MPTISATYPCLHKPATYPCRQRNASHPRHRQSLGRQTPCAATTGPVSRGPCDKLSSTRLFTLVHTTHSLLLFLSTPKNQRHFLSFKVRTKVINKCRAIKWRNQCKYCRQIFGEFPLSVNQLFSPAPSLYVSVAGHKAWRVCTFVTAPFYEFLMRPFQGPHGDQGISTAKNKCRMVSSHKIN